MFWNSFSGLNDLFSKAKLRKPYTISEQTSLKRFSLAVVILGIFPLLLLFIFTLIIMLRFGNIGIEQFLLSMLLAFSALYFIIPMLAAKVLNSLIRKRSAKKKRKN